MAHLFAALAPARQGAWTPGSEELGERLLADLAPGDVIMIKGSNGSRMGPVAETLRRKLGTA
jgi:UDP-N-acetylmuramoyl-tripeptide--D-alanyl-D-alanine ligase